ncbi:hypothetical protein SEEN2RVB_08783 [Salmonella enterica subsp. enterica serovar Newport str. A182RVB]|nr:hypothetical protein SEEN2RVB_08783 [Salmonella enterica subsp. enterica serovar Newport str. A182RVB]
MRTQLASRLRQSQRRELRLRFFSRLLRCVQRLLPGV